MASAPENPERAGRLQRLFREVLTGNRELKTGSDAKLFLEAICVQPSPAECIERIVSKAPGINAVRSSVRADLSSDFIKSSTLKFIGYLSDPAVKLLANGQLLQDLLLVVVDPPTVWRAVTTLFLAHKLPEDCLQPFAWIVHELISLPFPVDLDLEEDFKAIVGDGGLLRSSTHQTREYGYKVKHAIESKSASTSTSPTKSYAPGGRHDNDFADFRKIRIFPTTDEFLSAETPFYRKLSEVSEVDEKTREAVHLDNQFRLLREDMLAELRNDLQVAMGKKPGARKAMVLGNLRPVRIDHGDDDRGKLCVLQVQCFKGLETLWNLSPDKRKGFLKDQANFLRNDAFGVLCQGQTIFGFAFVERDVDDLAAEPPLVSLRFADAGSLEKALIALKTPRDINFILVNTPVFAYEPVLKALKSNLDLPLARPILRLEQPNTFEPVDRVRKFVAQLRGLRLSDGSVTLPRSSLSFESPICLDKSQADSLLNALTSDVTQIQGPPGTGKSFIGAQICKVLSQLGKLRILVIAYTNHSLDQFLHDLQKTGIAWDSMLRLGSRSKCTPQTEQILLSTQKNRSKLSTDSWARVNQLKEEAELLAVTLSNAFSRYRGFSLTWSVLCEHLEFSEDERHFYDAFLVPSERGWSQAGRNQRAIGPDFLFQQWSQGRRCPQMFTRQVIKSSQPVWDMQLPARKATIAKWTEEMVGANVQTILGLVQKYDEIQRRLKTVFDQGKVELMKSKEIIGCTTTAAATHSALVRAAQPDVVLVEEAGEIMESHILTALCPSVKQLIQIGDHKQLRPKVNNYNLTVEKGGGFDLNRSMFERMILQGAPHTTLRKQHRMCPEISLYVRELTYPELVDDEKTKNRPPIRGLRDRVVFLNHSKPEETDNAIGDRQEPGVKASKKNAFEAGLVLSCVKYFIQQGYKSEHIVVLTPYLGQLRLLREQLQDRAGVDPLLNDLDSYELVRAGLQSEAAGKVSKTPLRLATIDNYQGEESDIVIASLTRSNGAGDIGFMCAPERLNVLISRARNCLVMVGNMETFMASKRGKATWVPFFEIMRRQNSLYDGLPVKCEQHADTTALLKEPSDFEAFCPDGGCSKPCGVLLGCKLHICQRRCHRNLGHAKTECKATVEKTCARHHKRKVACGKQHTICPECDREDKETERRVKRNFKMEADRLAREATYRRELQQIQDELDYQRRLRQYDAEKEEQKKTLEQQRAELKATEASVKRAGEQKARQKQAEQAAEARKQSQPTPATGDWALPGSAKHEWQQLKEMELAESPALDELMDMIGLEDVKTQFLSIKSKVDALIRQNASIKSERFGASLLGNPGTGKTTVARLYAKFLTSVGVIPGSRFEETTGARLANMGVSGCKKLLDDVLNDGGGVVFIDEAYQLSSGNNAGGAGVLDFLLAEVENLTGKVIFVLAGYNKQMETFFSHNPGIPSRFPREMKFADYTDDELLRILKMKIQSKYKGAMACEGGLDGLYCWIVARRIGYGRGSDGFGNARTVENALARISDRQAERLRKERSKRNKPDDLLFTKEDLIGPEPSNALAGCEAWVKLQELTGLASVKAEIKALVDTLAENYRRELEREPPVQYSLNRVFLGNPGTGKTTIAKLLGQVLVHLGLLSKGEVVVRNPSDFVGAALGQSEQQTKGILAAAVGKVLVIDEAYGLCPPQGNGSGSASDPYKTAVIDTIVAEVQSVPGDDRCVLLLGYKDQMESMMQNSNPGLSRRFPLSNAFTFDDFTDDELQTILSLKLKQQGFQATGQAKSVVRDMLSRARNRPNFGNAGEIDILLNAAKSRHQSRVSKGEAKNPKLLEALDFDENFDRADRTETNIRMLFEGTVGCEETMALLEGYLETVRTMKQLGEDPKESIPFNFLFRGPPGTGKTTTARKLGKVFYDMGFLADTEVVECSASDLIAQYVGQTGPKVRQILDKALGKVLFLDEAYRLNGGGFAKEAIDELVDAVTKPRYFKKMVIIMAGYEKDINELLTVNSGLSSRFPEVIDFRALSAPECVDLLLKLLSGKKASLRSKGHILDLSVLEAPTARFRSRLVGLFTRLSEQDNWGSARDVQTLVKDVFGSTTKGAKAQVGKPMVVQEAFVESALQAMLDERESRSRSAAESRLSPVLEMLRTQTAAPPPPPRYTTRSVMKTAVEIVSEEVPPEEAEEEAPEDKTLCISMPSAEDTHRDVGVSDEDWEQLQKDKAAEEAREQEYQDMLKARRSADEEVRRRVVKKLLEEEARRKHEAEMKAKLAAAGVCPMGFAWVKQSGGYRCTGGSHCISDEELSRW